MQTFNYPLATNTTIVQPNYGQNGNKIPYSRNTPITDSVSIKFGNSSSTCLELARQYAKNRNILEQILKPLSIVTSEMLGGVARARGMSESEAAAFARNMHNKALGKMIDQELVETMREISTKLFATRFTEEELRILIRYASSDDYLQLAERINTRLPELVREELVPELVARSRGEQDNLDAKQQVLKDFTKAESLRVLTQFCGGDAEKAEHILNTLDSINEKILEHPKVQGIFSNTPVIDPN